MNQASRRTCATCSLRPTCQQPCPDVARLLPHDNTGRVAGLQRRNARLYGQRLEGRRRYVRFLLDWRDVLGGNARRAFDLRYNDGLGVGAIARRMGVKPGTASTYLKRARATIRAAARRGGSR